MTLRAAIARAGRGLGRALGAIGVGLGLGLGTLIAATPARAAPAAPHALPVDMPGDRSGPPGSERMREMPASADELALGERIYREGIGRDGQPIVGLRFGGIEARGAAVACASCHRRSGLGSVEGTDLVAPVAGRFIFDDDARAVVSMNFRNIKSFNQRHAPFDAASFAAAVRAGQHVDGRELSLIMPRYALDDTELQAVAAYLRTLSATWSPGVTAKRLRLATVITPEVSAERRRIFIETTRAAVNQKNGNVVPGQRTMSSAAEMIFRTDRAWDLDVWELQGAPDTWAAQLDAHYREEPVFALVSGLGGGTWAPVHAFCEQRQVPCWFPSVDAPPAPARGDFYSLYFSGGALLEADVLARHLAEQSPRPKRVVQLHRSDAAGLAASARLRAALAALDAHIQVEERRVVATDERSLRNALAGLGAQDALMLWWPREDAAALESVAPPAAPVYLSARLAAPEGAALPARWKQALRLVYPYQLPDKRQAGLFYFHAWLKMRQIDLRDEVLQSEVYFAWSYLAETLTDMIDNVHRDYLVERAESMLSLREGAKAEDQARELTVARHNKTVGGAQGAMARLDLPESRKSPRPMPGRADQVFTRREGTTIYPRLGLGQGQRTASKGAYIAHFAPVDGADTVVADSDWIVP